MRRRRHGLMGGYSLAQAIAAGVLGGGGYLSRVLTTDPLAVWPLNEGSGTVINDRSGNGYNGTYSGVTWDGTAPPTGGQAPFWDGANDYGNIYSAGLASAFDLDEFTIMLWLKVAAASVWTDGVARGLIYLMRDANNEARIQKQVGANTVLLLRHTQGVTKSVSLSDFTQTDFICLAISASIAGGGLLDAGDFRAYRDGTQIGTTQTGALAAMGSGLSSTATVIGALSTTPVNVSHGYHAFASIWNRPMAADILALMTV